MLDELIALTEYCRLIPILGNHDEMMLHARDGRDDLRFWLVPLDRQDGQSLRWLSLRDYVPGPHVSGKTAVLGHTPQHEC